MYDVSPDGADSSTKVDLSQWAIRLSGNSTPGGQSVTSNSAGGSPAEMIIRLLFGDVCDWAGPFFWNSRKTVTWPPENRDSVAVRFHLKTAVFGFGWKTITALPSNVSNNPNPNPSPNNRNHNYTLRMENSMEQIQISVLGDGRYHL